MSRVLRFLTCFRSTLLLICKIYIKGRIYQKGDELLNFLDQNKK